MILLIDAGNTRIKWRLVAATDPQHMVDEGVLEHAELGELATLRARPTTRIFATNVAGAEVAARISGALAPVRIHWIRSGTESCGVRNSYDAPDQLGADRWVALVGARRLHPYACLVVSAGTASTVDVLCANGDFAGGLILPGVELMQQSLARGTAQLPHAHGQFSALPRNTVDAIHSGCMQAQAGAVERMFRHIAVEPHALCLLGGGAANSFAGLLEIPVRRVDNLVLQGLAAIAEQEQG